MKNLSSVCVVVGITIIVIGIVLAAAPTFAYIQAPEESWSQPGSFQWSSLGYLGGFLISVPGAILAWIGGVAARPPYLWKILIAVGVVYCAMFLAGVLYPTYKELTYSDKYPGFSFVELIPGVIFLIPGASCVLEGLAFRKGHSEEKLKADSAV